MLSFVCMFVLYWQSFSFLFADDNLRYLDQSDRCFAVSRRPDGTWEWQLDWCVAEHRFACVQGITMLLLFTTIRGPLSARFNSFAEKEVHGYPCWRLVLYFRFTSYSEPHIATNNDSENDDTSPSDVSNAETRHAGPCFDNSRRPFCRFVRSKLRFHFSVGMVSSKTFHALSNMFYLFNHVDKLCFVYLVNIKTCKLFHSSVNVM